VEERYRRLDAVLAEINTDSDIHTDIDIEGEQQ
jgi:hypothetical protein